MMIKNPTKQKEHNEFKKRGKKGTGKRTGTGTGTQVAIRIKFINNK